MWPIGVGGMAGASLGTLVQVVSVLMLGIGLVAIAGLVVFDLVLARVGVDVPSILRDLLLVSVAVALVMGFLRLAGLDLFSLVEAFGLMFRVSWACWLAIGESAFFIPIEIYELLHRHSQEPGHSGHPITLFIILLANILIVWYLFQNRARLFRHHHH